MNVWLALRDFCVEFTWIYFGGEAEENKKTARAFFAEIYRSGNAAGDYCKATLWHTQKSA